MNCTEQSAGSPAILPGPDGKFRPCPAVMTEEELVWFLRVPEISNARNHHNVIQNLKPCMACHAFISAEGPFT